MTIKHATIDGNQAAAYVAYKINEVIAIYPITPASPMGEWADEWMAAGEKNIWGTTPLVQEMQSEAGAAGVVHGSLQAGTLATTFTASQGLLLMIPSMYKIAGELTPMVMHVAARTLASHALSIFGDHSDVMAVRQTGFALLCSGSVQEAMDFALVSQSATLESRVPFLHFFDGFRTSHEVAKIEHLSEENILAMIEEKFVQEHRQRGLSPNNPVIRGTSQNPDVFFQSREAGSPYYAACPTVVQKAFDKFAKLTGRQYHLFDYYGDPQAHRVIVLMGSGAETVQETVDQLNQQGEKVGLLRVRLYRPFAVERFINALPRTVKAVAVLDRTKEPGSVGEPLYLDVVGAFHEGRKDHFMQPVAVVGGRYGLSSKEFTPAMIKGIFNELKAVKPKNHFTVGIIDDVSFSSLDYDAHFSTEADDVYRAIFYGLGSDGTVSANKNSIKIIGENTPNFAQGYFVYDSKKSGSVTISHLRFGPRPIHSAYLVQSAHFIGCHQFGFLERYDVLKEARKEAIVLLNSPYGPGEVWDHLPEKVQETVIAKNLKLYVIDAYAVARKAQMGPHINTVMQTCFFAISGILPRDEAIAAIKAFIEKSYKKKGEAIVQMNFAAVDQTLDNLHEVKYPHKVTSRLGLRPPVSSKAPEFVRDVTAKIISGCGDSLGVGKMPVDGTFPVATAQWEKRSIAHEVPVWDEKICIQCGKCAMVCPHAVIRIKAYDAKFLSGAPQTFKSVAASDREWDAMKYTIQVSPEDCTGCTLCVEVCPVRDKSQTKLKAINMAPVEQVREAEIKNWDFFLSIPEMDRRLIKRSSIRQSQIFQPLFEFSGACAGCGETPYIKLMTQLFGDRAVVANATGCSSIYGGNLPTTPWAKNKEGRGPAWANSLFEDNAEFGLGFRLAIDKQHDMAVELLKKISARVGDSLVGDIILAKQDDEAGIYDQRQRVEFLKTKLAGMNSPEARHLSGVIDALVKKSVWIVGGDGWAYDIGFGGLDHVLSCGRDVNVLVLDTEVYSNTGGQMSKSTPRSAVAKFAAGGKQMPKKDLARIVMTYGYIYVASVAMGAKDEHTLRVFLEAESYPGPSLIIAYSHCIAHGIDMAKGLEDQKAAVLSGYWPLFRYNPRLAAEGKEPFVLDSQPPKIPFKEFAYRQNRFNMLTKSHPEEAKRLLDLAQSDIRERWKIYQYLAAPAGAVNVPQQQNVAVVSEAGKG